MDFNAFWQQPLATALPAAGQSSPAAFRAHPRAKTVLVLSSALRAL